MTEADKHELTEALNRPAVQRAIRNCCSGLKRCGAKNLEESAMAQAYNEGFLEAFDSLFREADIKTKNQVQPRKLKN